MRKLPHLLPLLLLFILVLLTSCSSTLPDNLHEATFVRVVDGDTLIANIDGKEEYVRLILVDTPETKHPKQPVQPFGPEASAFMEHTYKPSDTIQLEYGPEKRDIYDRILAYVYTEDGDMFNKLLLKKGLARVAVYPPNDKYVDEFRKLEQKAKKQKIGIWSIDGDVTEDDFNMDAIKP